MKLKKSSLVLPISIAIHLLIINGVLYLMTPETYLEGPNALYYNFAWLLITSALDFYPTFAHLAKANIPASKQLDGKNIWEDFVKGSNPRQGEMIYALRHREGYSDVGARQDNWKVLKTQQNAWALYDVEKDMGEQTDLSAQHPERVKEMVSKAEQWSKSHVEPLWFDPMKLEKIWEEKEMAKFENTFKVEN